MSNPARKHRDERRLAERYTLRRRVQSAKFTRAGDRHAAHADDEETPVGASGQDRPLSGSSPTDADDIEINAPPASTDEEVRL